MLAEKRKAGARDYKLNYSDKKKLILEKNLLI
jgi:hypothetical protein